MPNLNNLKADQDNGKDPILGIYRARVESNLDPLHLGRCSQNPDWSHYPVAILSRPPGCCPRSCPESGENPVLIPVSSFGILF